MSSGDASAQNDDLGLYFRAALDPKNYSIADVRFLHDVAPAIAAFVRNAIQDETADDLDAFNENGDAEISLQAIQWKAPGLFGPSGLTFYLEIIDEDAGTLTDYLLSATSDIIAQWSAG